MAGGFPAINHCTCFNWLPSGMTANDTSLGPVQGSSTAGSVGNSRDCWLLVCWVRLCYSSIACHLAVQEQWAATVANLGMNSNTPVCTLPFCSKNAATSGSSNTASNDSTLQLAWNCLLLTWEGFLPTWEIFMGLEVWVTNKGIAIQQQASSHSRRQSSSSTTSWCATVRHCMAVVLVPPIATKPALDACAMHSHMVLVKSNEQSTAWCWCVGGAAADCRLWPLPVALGACVLSSKLVGPGSCTGIGVQGLDWSLVGLEIGQVGVGAFVGNV